MVLDIFSFLVFKYLTLNITLWGWHDWRYIISEFHIDKSFSTQTKVLFCIFWITYTCENHIIYPILSILKGFSKKDINEFWNLCVYTFDFMIYLRSLFSVLLFFCSYILFHCFNNILSIFFLVFFRLNYVGFTFYKIKAVLLCHMQDITTK